LLGFPSFLVIIRLLYDERRNIRQQISIWVDKDYKDRFKEEDNITRLGLGTLNN